MRAPGVEVRPLRQITGEAEFNEVFLTDVRLPDSLRLGAVGEGWQVARSTLMNERVSIGGGAIPREGGAIGVLADLWRERPDLRSPALHGDVMRAWVDSEAARLTATRLRQQLTAGEVGPEGSAVKLTFANLMQRISGLELEMRGEESLRHEAWAGGRGRDVPFFDRSPGYRYLRSRGNSIEGGTSEILRNIIAERVLGLPSEPRSDKDIPWKDLPR
jgi:alkylation response protein AidB-like acyl-CoA dehydrogenase